MAVVEVLGRNVRGRSEVAQRLSRNVEARALILVSVGLLCGLWLVYQVRSQRPINFSDVPERARGSQRTPSGAGSALPAGLLNLNRVKSADEIAPYLVNFEEAEERAFAARKIFESRSAAGEVRNVGALGVIRVTEADLRGQPGLEFFKAELETARAVAAERKAARAGRGGLDPVGWLRSLFRREAEASVEVPLIKQVGAVKPSFIVRTPREFRNSLLTSAAVFLLTFWGLHLYWRARGFAGDQIILPNICALCSLGFLMMISLRDPLRDTLTFSGFAWGTLAGGVVMALLTTFDYYRFYYALKARLPHADSLITAAPIAVALLLCAALILFGSGPGGSDAKVNLNVGVTVFQPSELIKILVVLFVAAYFSRHWELIQNLSQRKVPVLSIPRVRDVWVIVLCVAAVLVLFILQKDLGPAFLMAGTFLILFTMVRGHLVLSLAGFGSIIAAYLVNYYVVRFSQTAADRFDIWLSPWDTTVRGGEQIVHSFWALAAGGVTGTGLGLGDPRFAPAAHTDLILSSLGEEFGFVGLAMIFALYATLTYRCLRIALDAASPYAFFLASGLTIINALQVLFISAAVLGLIPLSGVVSPFLSFGSTSMVMNFAAFGIVLAVSAQGGRASREVQGSFAPSARRLAWAFGVGAILVLTKAAWIQMVYAEEITLKSVLAPQADEVRRESGVEKRLSGIRRYRENPRIRQVLGELPYGTIYDRGGLPLASSDWEKLERHRQAYADLGIQLDRVCRKGSRCYPFGAATYFLLGDARTKKNWSRTNNFIEKDYEARLRGFDDHPTTEFIEVRQVTTGPEPTAEDAPDDTSSPPPPAKEETIAFPIVKRDYRELLPLLRHRYLPLDLEAYRLRYKERDLTTSIDARLQLSLTRILEEELKTRKLTRAAAVVLDPASGDLLANVSYPYPAAGPSEGGGGEGAEDPYSEADRLIDRARQGMQPPGSTFKILTAMAAVRRDPAAFYKVFNCEPMGGGRGGKVVRGRAVRDSAGHGADGDISFDQGLIRSCNAYFAQLGVEVAGAEETFKTAKLFNIVVGTPDTAEVLDMYLPQSAFGQGQVLATPFQMAKIAATVANQGTMPFGRWVIDENNLRVTQPTVVISPEQARAIARAMVGVTEDADHGTAYRAFAGLPVRVAGKTGTAQNGRRVDGRYIPEPPHSWFVGFAPFEGQRRIAFAVLVENGGGGAGAAAAITKKMLSDPAALRLIE